MDWFDFFYNELKKDSIRTLVKKVQHFYETSTCYPEHSNIFNAFKLTPLDKVKVVIVGQDPYHGENQAHGLAFSVQPNVAIPPSLLNIYKELQSDIGCFIPNNGYLIPWSDQGVLLLNTALTVRAHEANSHKGIGWETFTDRIIELLSERTDPVIFVLWGANARKKTSLIDTSKHYILEAPHPSPLSARRGFFGCKHFSKINEILIELGKRPIDWQINNI